MKNILSEDPVNFTPTACAWSYRWHKDGKPGMHLMTCYVPGFGTKQHFAVVDDFGELVMVRP